MQDGTPYVVCPGGNNPKFISLANLINCDNLHSLGMHSVLSHYILDEEENDREERNICFSYSTPREIAQGLKRI